MEFKLDEAELRQLAQIEAETHCDIGAGFDWGQSLGNYLSQATHAVNQARLLEVLRDSLGDVLSQEELEEAAQNIQEQLRNRVIEKLQTTNASTA